MPCPPAGSLPVWPHHLPVWPHHFDAAFESLISRASARSRARGVLMPFEPSRGRAAARHERGEAGTRLMSQRMGRNPFVQKPRPSGRTSQPAACPSLTPARDDPGRRASAVEASRPVAARARLRRHAGSPARNATGPTTTLLRWASSCSAAHGTVKWAPADAAQRGLRARLERSRAPADVAPCRSPRCKALRAASRGPAYGLGLLISIWRWSVVGFHFWKLSA
jgi:hypothetical protein